MKSKNAHLKNLVKPIQGKRKLKLPKTDDMHHSSGHVKSIRRDEHRGKKIEVHTTYKFYIDGKPIDIHASVMNDGKVHCHNLPQYAFSSAIRMMKSVIDVMNIKLPADELSGNKQAKHKGKQNKSHGHGG